MGKLKAADLKKYFWVFVLIWSVGIVASMGWNVSQQKRSMIQAAWTSARISFDKDIIYRRWASLQGGIYVPVSEMTPSNPFLEVPHRDIVTEDGRMLTLVNPAYMTRQINEMTMEMSDYLGHITSLDPIRPENSPDPWEREALKSFQSGMIKEASSIETIDGQEYFRFMSPFITEESCLPCHSSQGYQVGDIRGGISIAIPMAPLRAIERSRVAQLILAHGFLWVVGFAGISAGMGRLRSQMLAREKMEDEIRELLITDHLTDLHNRRGFLSLAEQQLKLSNRTKKRLLLFFIDLDGLKWINDTLGHAEGDAAIVETAIVLRKTFRSSDIIARIGGDEFAVLAVNAEEIDPDVMKNRLQEEIELCNSRDRRYQLSVSVGVSSFDPENPVSIDLLMVRADEQMYNEKRLKHGGGPVGNKSPNHRAENHWADRV
jgi:diguanylate cyclase (GGDEF)-like protein